MGTLARPVRTTGKSARPPRESDLVSGVRAAVNDADDQREERRTFDEGGRDEIGRASCRERVCVPV